METNPDQTPQQNGDAGETLTPWRPLETEMALPPPRSTISRVLEGAAWIGGVVVFLIIGRAWLILSGSRQSGFEQGEQLGSIVGAILLALVIRWAWVRYRKRGRVRSPWIMLLASLILAGQLGQQAGAATTGFTPAPTPARPIAAYLAVGSPYSLGPAPSQIAQEFGSSSVTKFATETAVRQISVDGQAVGYLAVLNIGADSTTDAMDGIESGFEKNVGATATSGVVAGHPVVIGTRPDVIALIWAEAPYMLVIYAADEESGKVLVASVIASYK